MYKIMFSAGETSGDMHGANLAKALKHLHPNIEMFGFGGPQMEAAGVKLSKNMLDYSVMGFAEVLVNLRKLFKLKSYLKQKMIEERPDVLVLIDYPDFNWRLAKEAKKLGIPVFSYIPPSAWAWRKGRAKKCAEIADKIAAIFPFEIAVYKEAGADITYVGNPLIDNVVPSMNIEEARLFFGINPEDDNILLLPGSRKQEIAKMLEPMLEAAKLILAERPKAKFFLPIANGIDQELLQNKIDGYGLQVKLCKDYTYDLMGICDFGIATSGTVTLEAALRGLPTIVLYKMSKLTYRIAKMFVKIKFFSLPNILLGKKVLPELLQNDVNGETIKDVARNFYKDAPNRQEIIAELSEVRQRLGEGEVAIATAKLIIETIEKAKVFQKEKVYE